MKISQHNFFFSLAFLTFFAFLFSQSISAQEKLMGEITITKSSAPESRKYVIVNGERVSSGRTIMSPADISTPSGVSAKIMLAKTGTILVSPDSNLELSFINSSISGVLTAGEVTIETVSGTKISFQTPDGTITVPDSDQLNIVKITVVNGEARINTLVGKVLFNTALISAGDYFPKQTTVQATAKKDAKDNNNTLLIVLLISAAAAAALVGLSVASGGNNESAPVSPFR